MLVFHSKHRPLDEIQVASASVTSSDSAKNTGVVLDSTLSFNKRVTQICKSSFYAIRNISRIRKFLGFQTAKILVHAFVSSKLDSCNSLLYGLPKNLLRACNMLGLSPRQENQLMLRLYLLSCTGCLLSSVLNLRCYF